jgi:hypothetical protein
LRLSARAEACKGNHLSSIIRRLTGGIKSVAVREQEYSDYALVKPPDQFWPLRRYVKKFGTVGSNKKLGHVKTNIKGVVGVLVPTDNEDQPWLLERREGTRQEADKEHDVGSSDGDEDVADAVFNNLGKQRVAEYAKQAAGALASILAECELDDEERKKQAAKRKLTKKKKRKATPGSSTKKLGFMMAVDSDDEDMMSEDPAVDERASKRPRGSPGNKLGDVKLPINR